MTEQITLEEWFATRIRHPRKRKVAARPRPQRVSGYVYVVRDPTSGLYKIGCSANLPQRIKQLNSYLPIGKLDVILLLPTPAYRTLERDLHARFGRQRVKGEWFSLADEDLERLKHEYVRVKQP